MLIITPGTVTFAARQSGNPDPVTKGLTERHKSKGFTSKSKSLMTKRLRNFMFVRAFSLNEKGVYIKKDVEKLTFFHLTLPAKQVHTDTQIKKVCLDNMLNKLRYHLGSFSYIWKAEAQKNGNIHFHIILTKFIKRDLADKLWWDSLELLGYVTEYEKKWKKRTPPTNKIEYAKTLRKVMAYCTKYVAKINEGRIIEGCNWFCSKDIQTEVSAQIIMSDKEERVIKKKLRNLGLFNVANEYAEKFFFSTAEDYKELPMKLRNEYEEIIQYALGRSICEDGMQRIYKKESYVTLREYTGKRKIKIQGLQEFPSDLFDSGI